MNESLFVTALWASHTPRVDVSSGHSNQSDHCVPNAWVAMCVVDATDSSREHSAPDSPVPSHPRIPPTVGLMSRWPTSSIVVEACGHIDAPRQPG
jgi:hypothetical protein